MRVTTWKNKLEETRRRGKRHLIIVVTGLQEFDYDISGGFEVIDRCGYPLSMIIQGKKLS